MGDAPDKQIYRLIQLVAGQAGLIRVHKFPISKKHVFANGSGRVTDDRNLILNMLAQGASGYVLKSAPMEEIEQAILHIHGRGVYLGPGAQKSIATSKPGIPDKIPPVTRREKEVLQYFAQGLSSAEIADKMFVSPLTVNVHRRNLLQKFKVNNTVSLLQKAKDLVNQ